MSATNSVDGALLSAGKTEIETFTGRFVDVLNPKPDTIVIDDIAHGLAMTCRYGGHIKKFYSVAEHCVLVMRLVEWYERAHTHAFDADEDEWPDVDKCLLRNALLHDAPEAYLGDVVAPLKYALREGMMPHDKNVGYDSLTERMDKAIDDAFGYGRMQMSAVIQLCDLWALKIEAAWLTYTGGANWRWPGVLPCDGAIPTGLNFDPKEMGEQPFAARQNFINAWVEVKP